MPPVSLRSHTQCHARGGGGGVSELGVPAWGRDAPAASSEELLSLVRSVHSDWGFSITCQDRECLHSFFFCPQNG